MDIDLIIQKNTYTCTCNTDDQNQQKLRSIWFRIKGNDRITPEREIKALEDYWLRANNIETIPIMDKKSMLVHRNFFL